MGQRANLIVGNERGYDLYYTHWRANTLDSDLFWGPSVAESFIRSQRSEREGAEWLDEVWAEGGAVLDPERRVLLWFGGEDILHNVPLRRLHQRFMGEFWPGWSLRWAANHIIDLANYVGRSTEDLFSQSKEPPGTFVIEEPGEPDWISTVLSFCGRDGAWRFHAVDADIEHVAGLGPVLYERLRESHLPGFYDFAARTSCFPDGGVHVDEASRQVLVWRSDPGCMTRERCQLAWPGWEVVWLGDSFEKWTGCLQGRLTLPHKSHQELVAQVRAIVSRPVRDYSGLTMEVSQKLAGKKSIEINPFSLRDDAPVPVNPELIAKFDAVAATLEPGGS